MSNSIWKTPDQKRETGKQILEHWKNTDNEDCYAAWLVAHSFDKQTNRWYINELIAQADKAELLQKAVDCALEELQRVAEDEDIDWLRAESARTTIDEIKQLIKGN